MEEVLDDAEAANPLIPLQIAEESKTQMNEMSEGQVLHISLSLSLSLSLSNSSCVFELCVAVMSSACQATSMASACPFKAPKLPLNTQIYAHSVSRF